MKHTKQLYNIVLNGVMQYEETQWIVKHPLSKTKDLKKRIKKISNIDNKSGSVMLLGVEEYNINVS